MVLAGRKPPLMPGGVPTEQEAQVFDGKMWLLGGYSSGVSVYNDVWYSTDGSSWTQATSNAGWSARKQFNSVVHQNKLWVMGGINYGNTAGFNDVWYTADGINWSQATAAAAWGPLRDSTAVSFKGEMWVLAGVDGYNGGNSLKPYFWRTASGPINWNDNASVAHGANLTDNANDPTHSGHTNVNQTYSEYNGFTNSVAGMVAGEDGLWDFSLKDNGAPYETTYCFRTVKADGSPLDSYSNYAEVQTFIPNQPPNTPSSLGQNRVTGGATVATGGWTNENQIRLSAQATDPDIGDTLQLCIETKLLGTAFNGTGEVCGTGVTYSGTAVTVTADATSQANGQYHWQARIKDAEGEYLWMAKLRR